MVLVLELGLSSLTSRPNGLRVISVESTGRFGVIPGYLVKPYVDLDTVQGDSQLRAVFVVSGN